MASTTVALDLAAQHRRGRLFVVFAAVAWSTAGILQRELSAGVATQIAGRAFFAVLACNLGKKTNSNNANTDTEAGSGAAIKEMYMAKDDGGQPGEYTSTFAPGDRTIVSFWQATPKL